MQRSKVKTMILELMNELSLDEQIILIDELKHDRVFSNIEHHYKSSNVELANAARLIKEKGPMKYAIQQDEVE